MRKFLLVSLAISVNFCAMAQNVGINNDGSDPDPSAMLDIKSSERGLLIPRMDAAARTTIASPADGLLVYDIDSDSFWYYDGGWNELSPSAAQTLSVIGQNLSISDGNTVTLPEPDLLQDADMDTRVRVDDGTDSDLVEIFIDNAGTPNFRFTQNGLEFLNDNNIRIGQNAGAATTSHSNVFVGDDAGASNVSNTYNTFVGDEAGRLAQGNSNTFIGAESGELSTSGNGNTFVGDYSGHSSNGGSNNVLIGASSGQAITTGSGNVVIGRTAGPTSDQSNRLFIDNSQTSTPLIYGEFDNNHVEINGTLGINGSYTLPNADGSAGQVLSSDGAGNIAWADGASAQTLSLFGNDLTISGGNTVTLPGSSGLQDGDGDTFVRVDDGADFDLIEMFVGDALTPQVTINDNQIEVHTGTNLLIGNDAGDGVSGFANTVIGQSAGFDLSGGGQNVYLGNLAGASNSSSNYNTSVGAYAGENSTGQSNTYIGAWSARNATTGSSNIVIGDYTAQDLAAGGSNVIIGTSAGNNIESGVGNVVLGTGVNPTSDVSNELWVGVGSSVLLHGDFSNDHLQVNGTLEINNSYTLPSTDGGAGQVLQTDGSGNIAWATGGGSGLFEESSDVIRPTAGYSDDDFVLGSPQLDGDGVFAHWNRLMFDKSKAAIYAGVSWDDSWDEVNRGDYSVSMGVNNKTSGVNATSFGGYNEVSGAYAVGIGQFINAESIYCVSIGKHNVGGGDPSIWSDDDPIFEVGIGSGESSRENALTVLKSGKIIMGPGDNISSTFGTGYEVVVDGKLLCEEVRVQDSGSWPDYVFDPEYNRMSFCELRSFVKEEKHLPGVPSESEINGNGFELGEMNEILLEKVEELYLYVLDLEERIAELQSNK